MPQRIFALYILFDLYKGTSPPPFRPLHAHGARRPTAPRVDERRRGGGGEDASGAAVAPS